MVVAQKNAEALAAGEALYFEGNVRGFWHAHIEGPLSRMSGRAPKYGYNTLIQTLSRMVFDERTLTYSELALTDALWEERRIGTTRPGTLVVGEKRSMFRMLRRIHEAHGVTVSVTGGYPSGVTSEYTAAHVLEALAARGEGPEVTVVGVNDYGPHGWEILDVFCAHIERFGLRVIDKRRAFGLDAVPAETLPFVTRPVVGAARRRHTVAEWMAATGGVGGELLQVDVESITAEALEARVLEVMGVR